MNNEHSILTGTIHIEGKFNGEQIDKVIDIDFPILCRDWEKQTGFDEQDPNVGWYLISSTTKMDYDYMSDFSLSELNSFSRTYMTFKTQEEKDNYAEKVTQYMDNGHSLLTAMFEISREKVK